MSALKNVKVGIVGSGLIGRSWAMLFAGAGYNVAIFDEVPEQIKAALDDIRDQLETHEKNGMLKGTLTSGEQCSLISPAKSLAECVSGAVHVQECVFENVDLKRSLFLELDKVASDSVVLSSSTSCFPPSKFTEGLQHRAQAIVSHPVNPPYYAPMVELVPAPWTSPETVEKTRNIMISIGQKPVTLKKEIPGFVLNRIQYAILNECYRLVQDDIVTVEDVDIVMSEGLGMRYAFMGPLETAYLNADGMIDYCRRYAQGIYDVSQTFGPVPFFGGETAQKIQDELNAKVPMETLQQRRKWRDNCLMHLAQIKKKAGQ